VDLDGRGVYSSFMTRDASRESVPPSRGQHLATVSHDGRFWDVYLEFADDPRRPEDYRALLVYSPADRGDDEDVLRTIPLIIESSYEEAVRRGRAFEDHQLVAFLRSLLP
jgi:hypothetical protein